MSILLGLLALLPVRSESPEAAANPHTCAVDDPQNLNDSTPEQNPQKQKHP